MVRTFLHWKAVFFSGVGTIAFFLAGSDDISMISSSHVTVPGDMITESDVVVDPAGVDEEGVWCVIDTN